jgi:hypothetical protein
MKITLLDRKLLAAGQDVQEFERFPFGPKQLEHV